MVYPTNPAAERQRQELQTLAEAAISGDVLTGEGSGFMTAVMGRQKKLVQQDIPAAMEMYTLLSHFLARLPLHAVTFEGADVLLAPSILFDEPAGKVVALVPIGADELSLVALWIAAGIRSETVRKMAGVLALPFSIEMHSETQVLVPEWFAAFYVSGNEDHCVPTLIMQSVMDDDRFRDWVAVALERMSVFGLPNASAKGAIHQTTAS